MSSPRRSPTSSPQGSAMRLPGVDALLAGVTPFIAEHCAECDAGNRYECCILPPRTSSDPRPRSSSLQEPFTQKSKEVTRWRAGTFHESLPVTPLLHHKVLWPNSRDAMQMDSPANSLTTLSYGSSAPSSPASPRSPLPPQSELCSSDYYGSDAGSPSAEEDGSAFTLPAPEDHPNAAAAGVFAVFRPVDHGTSLAMAASGTTLADLHRDWKARLPPDTAPTPEEIRRKPLECPFCRRRFDRPSIRRTHMNSHTGERPFKCNVSGCKRTFSVLSNKYRHERSHKAQNPDREE